MEQVKRALVSVSDKSGLTPFIHELQVRCGIEVVSTGGTAQALRDAGVSVREVTEFTGFPELFDGRVKTLHPQIHGGILSERNRADHRQEMVNYAIAGIDLVVVNLYPFEQVTADPDQDLATAITNIDIGGPTLLRAGAKNYHHVVVIVDPKDYDRLLSELFRNGSVSESTRFELARKAFEHTARYEGAIAEFFGRVQQDGSRSLFPATLNRQLQKVRDMRYGENPHQQAALYREPGISEVCVATATPLQGKALSFNNVADLDAALEAIKEFSQPACVIVKHTNPCGVAEWSDLLGAYQAAFACDPESAFGGVIAFNGWVGEAVANALLERFVEVLIAPGYDEAALAVLAKRKNLRVLAIPTLGEGNPEGWDLKRVGGGVLIQERDHSLYQPDVLQVVTEQRPTDAQWRDLLFAWRVVKHTKSNAIVYAMGCTTVGIGAGQMSRADAVRLAATKARSPLEGSVMASDAFFPFRDGLDAAAEVGCSAVIQPGGSRRDEEVIDAANEHGLAMAFTGIRHFRH